MFYESYPILGVLSDIIPIIWSFSSSHSSYDECLWVLYLCTVDTGIASNEYVYWWSLFTFNAAITYTGCFTTKHQTEILT